MSEPKTQIEQLMELRESEQIEGEQAYVLPQNLWQALQTFGGQLQYDKNFKLYLTHPDHEGCRFYKSDPILRR